MTTSEEQTLYYKSNKYNRVLRNKMAIFTYIFFQYGGNINKIPSEYFDKVSRDEFKEWFEKIPNLSIKDYLTIPNVEDRRIVLSEYLNTDKGKAEILDVASIISTETLDKRTWWYDKNAEREVTYKDVYSLYMVELGNFFANNNNGNERTLSDFTDTNMKDSIGYIVLCKDTSTNRKYMLWVDMESILKTNSPNEEQETILHKYNDIFKKAKNMKDLKKRLSDFLPKHVGAIDAIAWTIMTTVPKDKIRKIIRQGDCILVDANIKDRSELVKEYHLSRKQYLEHMYKES